MCVCERACLCACLCACAIVYECNTMCQTASAIDYARELFTVSKGLVHTMIQKKTAKANNKSVLRTTYARVIMSKAKQSQHHTIQFPEYAVFSRKEASHAREMSTSDFIKGLSKRIRLT